MIRGEERNRKTGGKGTERGEKGEGSNKRGRVRKRGGQRTERGDEQEG